MSVNVETLLMVSHCCPSQPSMCRAMKIAASISSSSFRSAAWKSWRAFIKAHGQGKHEKREQVCFGSLLIMILAWVLFSHRRLCCPNKDSVWMNWFKKWDLNMWDIHTLANSWFWFVANWLHEWNSAIWIQYLEALINCFSEEFISRLSQEEKCRYLRFATNGKTKPFWQTKGYSNCEAGGMYCLATV